MHLELVASWSCSPDRELQRDWLKVVPGSAGIFLADGSLTVHAAHAGAPVVARLNLPPDAQVALDPRGQLVAFASDGQLSLVDLSGAPLAHAQTSPGFELQRLVFRADGERLWVFGSLDGAFRALAYDRALALVGDHVLALSGSPNGWPIHVHPTADAFVLTLSTADEDIRRAGVVIERGDARVVFDAGGIDHPCLGFTRDGSALVCVDPATRAMLFPWPAYECASEASFEPEHEGRPAGIVVGNHLVTERHSAPAIMYDPATQSAAAHEKHDSSLWVLALPSLDEAAVIRWSDRGFGSPEDDAGLEIVDAAGDDTFLEARGEDGRWALRVWRLAD